MKAFHHTTKNIGRNLVGQAVAQRLFKLAVLDFQIRLHTFEEGAKVASDILIVIDIFSIVLKLRTDPVIRGALSTAKACLNRNSEWHTIDAVAIDQGLARVLDIYPALKASAISNAWHEYMKEQT